ncbi:DUF5678 domain-containing protein [Sorangium sp. So ce315]|uniref:FitA-like ribbon-helix-helix domain-containing protein n=1 Tax=Sorangium sp. So ce315 TaxID=3133299 RepID=UPI003F640E6F
MAELVLRNIDPSLVQKLEQQAKRSGSTLEAEVVRVLEAEFMRRTTPADWGVTADPYEPDAELDADTGAPEEGAGTGRTSQPPEPPSDLHDTRAEALAERQAALAEAYPDEYVVLVDERLIAHTRDKDEAYAQYDAAFNEQGGGEPIVIPPGALRRIAPPALRGRAVPMARGAGRR